MKCYYHADNIQLFKDSRRFHSCIPKLMSVCSASPKIICVGIYLSESETSIKLPDVDLFLNKFVEVMSEFYNTGIILNNSKKWRSMRCYSQGRSKKIGAHSSYNACGRCIQKGVYAGGHYALLQLNTVPRTVAGFINKTDDCQNQALFRVFIERCKIYI